MNPICQIQSEMKQREGIVVPSFSKKGSLLCASWQYCSVCVTSCLVKYQTVLPLTTISVMITLFFPFVRLLVTMAVILLKFNRSYFFTNYILYCSVEFHSKMSYRVRTNKHPEARGRNCIYSQIIVS